MGLEKLNSKMVPREVAEQIVHGSYEDLIQKVGAAIEEQAAMFLPAGERKEVVFPVATFKNNVIVGTSVGEFYRAKFESVNGKVIIKSHEKIDVPVIDESNQQEYVAKSLASVVDEFMHGDHAKAFAQLAEIASVVEAAPSAPTDRAVAFVKTLRSGAWNQFVVEKREAYSGVIEGEEVEVAAQFKALYAEGFDASKLPVHTERVTKATAGLFEQLEYLWKVAKASYTSYKGGQPRTTKSEAEKAAVLRFEAFAESFVSDVSRKLRDGRGFVENGVLCGAIIHDGLAGMFEDIRIASGLVKYFAEQLRN